MTTFTKRARRGVAAAITAVAVALTGFLAGGTNTAHADQNSKITFSDASFKHVTDTGQPVTSRQEVRVGDYLEFSVNYDATNADPKPGDSFYIAFPKILTLRDAGAEKELKTADGTVAGTCKLVNASGSATANTLTCTLNEAIKDKIEVKGSLKLNLYVSGTTTSNNVEIDFNGTTNPVILPYDKPIVERPVSTWKPRTKPAKGSFGVGSNSTGIRWFIAASGDWLSANHPNGVVTIQDNLTPGVLFPHSDLTKFYLDERCPNPSNASTPTYTKVADASGMTRDGFSLELTVANVHELTIEAKGAWKAECEYVFFVETTFANGAKINKNYDYTNSATFTVPGTQVQSKRSYFETFEGTIQYRDGNGGFKVTKLVQGDDAAGYADHAYDFNYTCTDGQSGTLKVSQSGGVVISDKQFPAGTVCTVTEQNYERAGYTWRGTQSQDVTIEAGQTKQLDFVNTYTKWTAVSLIDPKVTPGVCAPGATKPSDPTVELPTVQGLNYGAPVITTNGDLVTVTVTVTVEDGYTVSEVPAGWTFNASNGSYTFITELNVSPCAAEPTVSPTPAPTPSPAKPTPAKPTPAKPTPLPKKPGMPKTGN